MDIVQQPTLEAIVSFYLGLVINSKGGMLHAMKLLEGKSLWVLTEPYRP
jgi:hypothetical protein